MTATPYAALTALGCEVAAGGPRLAGPARRRQGAFLIDSLNFMVAWRLGAAAMHTRGEALFRFSQTGIMAYVVPVLFGVNLSLLYQDGRGIGKRLLTRKVVRRDGIRASRGQGFSLRILVPGIVCRVPLPGALFAPVNIVFIFREDRRCIHDRMADTRVIAA